MTYWDWLKFKAIDNVIEAAVFVVAAVAFLVFFRVRKR